MRDFERGDSEEIARHPQSHSKIAELEEARAALARLAKECGEGSDGPCPIIASFG